MFYRLSNTATRLELESVLNIPMAYPLLYQPSSIIDGLKEHNLSIVTSENPHNVTFAIWGLLPQGYSEQWQTFQNIKNTLNFNTDDLRLDQCFKDSLYKRRCLIFVTGFFTTYIINGNTYPFYVYLDSKSPFCIAGIYNELEDGFLTCSMLISNKTNSLKHIQNLCTDVPMILDLQDAKTWLDQGLGVDEIDRLIDEPKQFNFKSYPISLDFYTEDNFDLDILKPVIFLPHIVNTFP